MITNSSYPQTLLEAVRFYSDLQVCHDFMVRIKWPDGKITCPKCGGEHVGEIKSRHMFQCKAKDCRKQFSTKVGTIFEDSPSGLDKWFVAVWCIVNAKNGISSYELSRALGVQQQSAWHMLHRIRLAMQTKSFHKPLDGEVESDETLIGGKVSNLHKHKRGRRSRQGKAIVQGLLKRGGEVRTKIIRDQKSHTLQRTVMMNVEKGSTVYTDAAGGYVGLENNHYTHEFVDHATKYVEGRVHTNGLENFWSLLKRTLGGSVCCCCPVPPAPLSR